jgi:hypothetical protein
MEVTRRRAVRLEDDQRCPLVERLFDEDEVSAHGDLAHTREVGEEITAEPFGPTFCARGS